MVPGALGIVIACFTDHRVDAGAAPT